MRELDGKDFELMALMPAETDELLRAIGFTRAALTRRLAWMRSNNYIHSSRMFNDKRYKMWMLTPEGMVAYKGYIKKLTGDKE